MRIITIHQYTIIARDSIFYKKGVEAQVHYPIPPHWQKCCNNWKYGLLDVAERIHQTELSLPMGPEMTDEDVRKVVEAVNSFKA